MNTASTSGSGPLPSNTIANPKGKLKAITTRSGVSNEGPLIPLPFSSLHKVVEWEPEVTKDTVQSSTENIQPLVVQTQVLIDELVVKQSMPYPSRVNKQKLCEKDDKLALKYLEIFRKLHFELSFADALLHMPKFATMFKSLLNNKEKLFDLAKTPVNENCSTVILKKLLEKLGDLGKFLIPCDFLELVEFLALADLGASINLMPLSIWEKLSLPELTPTQMILKLADRSTTRPAGIVKDVFVKVGKFHFPTDFVVVNYVVDPRVPLILERPFLRTGRALIDVYGEELTLQVDIHLLEEFLNDDPSSPLPPKELKFVEPKTKKSLINEPPELELKDLPSHLEGVVTNDDDDELIPTRLVTGWRVCIDYRKLNDATRKYHFSLSFMDQMLERLAKNEFYCFLDGFSDYFQIPINPQDQEKTTFTCLYGNFSYRRAENLAADHLSRLENPHQSELEKKEIAETFPHETLGMVTFRGDASTPWKSLFSRFGDPRAIISDRGIHFCNDQFAKVMLKYGVTHLMSTAYHPQTSGQVKVFQQPRLTTIRTNELKNMMASFFQMNTASTSGSGPLPSNTIANPKGELKSITTRSGLVLDGPFVPMPPPFINPKEDGRVEETLTDLDLAEYTIKVPPPLVQKAKPHSQRNYEELQEMSLFRLTLRHPDTINAAAGGTFMKRQPKECYNLIKNMTAHHNDWDTTVQRGESCSSLTSSNSEIAALKNEMKSLFSRFGDPRVSDRGIHFCNEQFAKVMLKYGVTHLMSTAYHPQTSGQVKVSNHGLKRFLERTVGKACHLPIKLEQKPCWTLKHCNFDLKTTGDHRKVQMNELNELHDQAYENSLIYKEKVKRIHGFKIKNRVFNIGDQVLLFNSQLKIFSGKVKICWIGPFIVSQVFPHGTVKLSSTNGPNFKANNHRLKQYFGGDIPPMVVPDLQTFPMDN
nr:reverse transcriptase domain-containing protein [Tanacetum cinerariifolium]